MTSAEVRHTIKEPDFNMLLNFDVKNENSGKIEAKNLDAIAHHGLTFDQAVISVGGFGTKISFYCCRKILNFHADLLYSRFFCRRVYKLYL